MCNSTIIHSKCLIAVELLYHLQNIPLAYVHVWHTMPSGNAPVIFQMMCHHDSKHVNLQGDLQNATAVRGTSVICSRSAQILGSAFQTSEQWGYSGKQQRAPCVNNAWLTCLEPLINIPLEVFFSLCLACAVCLFCQCP